jgi:hypothetical protein
VAANSAAFGMLCQMNVKDLDSSSPLRTFSGEANYLTRPVKVWEQPAEFYCPVVASLVTGGSHLLCAMLERTVRDLGGQIAAMDTDSAMIAKADMSLAKAEEEAKAVLAATRKAEQAADVRKNEDDVEIDADSFNQLVKALQQRTQCSPHYARKCVISGLQNGTLTKMLGGYGAQLAMRQSQTNAQAQTEYRAAMAKVSQAPSGSRVNALRQAYIENPDAFA